MIRDPSQRRRAMPGPLTRAFSSVATGGDTRQAGFSLIEVIIVVALMAFVYTIAIPQFNLRSGSEIASKLNQMAGDVRAAYDLAVLSGKTYRMVIVMASGDYWLEEADRPDITIGSDRIDRDPTEAEEKDEAAAFDTRFQEYVDLAGQAIVDPEDDKEIPAVSPVVQAKSKLKKPVWTKVDSMEWGARSLGPYLMVKDMQSEHHGHKQDFTELGAQARAMIYFFPQGYVQKAVVHIAFKKDEMMIDDTQDPYTLTTNPLEGTADVVPGYVEVDVHRDDET